jgi:two-component system, chemotaxis family, sensor kinase Cph1
VPKPSADQAALADEVARLRGELDATARAREILLAGVAHDLRNPLNTFAMSIGLLRDDLESGAVDPARSLTLIGRMERASTRMQSLIEDLLEAGRIDANAIELERKPESTKALLEQVASATKAMIEERGATLVVTLPSPDARIEVDRARIVQAMTKLVAYAQRTIGEGGTVTLAAESASGAMRLALKASSPSSRSRPTTAPDENRGGLSLLIARGLIAAHGSHIELDGVGGINASFTLPIAAG